MGRPVYENKKDRSREKVVARKISDSLGLTLIELPKLARGDYMAHNENDHLIIEIKTRSNKFDAYSEYMISSNKIDTLITISNELRFTAILVVGFNDKIVALVLEKNHNFKQRVGGRKDRNDDKDMEKMYYIPITEFVEI